VDFLLSQESIVKFHIELFISQFYSSGSTNPDSPGVENFTGKELKLSEEAQHLR